MTDEYKELPKYLAEMFAKMEIERINKYLDFKEYIKHPTTKRWPKGMGNVIRKIKV